MKKVNQAGSRRKFLAMGLLGSTSLIARPGHLMADAGEDNADLVKMLTADGRLVEVPASAIEKAGETRKVANRDILDWMKSHQPNT